MRKSAKRKLIYAALALVFAVLVYVIFQALERAGKVESADLITCIAISVVCICEAFSYWNTKRTFSYIAIAGAIFLIGVVVLISVL